MVFLNRPYLFKFLKSSIFFGPFLNTSYHFWETEVSSFTQIHLILQIKFGEDP